MSEHKCEYCGCKDINCLARCRKTGYYFCNGKGDTSNSHIVHYLREMNFDEIVLPEENRFSAVPLKCYVCETTNVYSLGFVATKDQKQIYLTCRKCQFDPKMVEVDINNDTFKPIICEGQVLKDIVKVPAEDQYEKVTMSRVMSVNQAIREKLGEEEPEEERGHALKQVSLSYESKEEFCEMMNEFVEHERSENEALEKKQRFTGIHVNWNSSNTCTFKAPLGLYRSVTLGSQLNFEHGGEKCIAFVTNKARNGVTVEVKFNAGECPLHGKTGPMTIIIVFNDLPFHRQSAALDLFGSDRNVMDYFLTDIILGHVEPGDEFNRKNRLKESYKLVEPPAEHFKPLNASQISAIRYALSNKFTMIQGPPGAGKTTVIAAIAHSLVKSGVKPVLVCAQSNVAADFATKRVSQTGVKVCRVLSSTREQVASDVDEFTTKKLAAAHFREKFTAALKSNDAEQYKNVTKMEQHIVGTSDVVCTTCTSAGGARLGGHNKFKAVIFDESGQCVDPDLLIPLVHGARQFILVGDHKQLGPVILSKKCRNARYDLPLMQRLVLLGIKPSILRMQYRMHPGLSAFPSEAFYQGFLKDGVSCQQRRWKEDFIRWPNPEIPMFFWNVKSDEEYFENGISYVNRHEAGCIAVLLDAMAKKGIKSQDIGIITPYAGQQAFLVESLPSLCSIRDVSFFDDLEIASVDAFQGREKNFIILSNVRANQNHEIGFLKDPRRMCVSLTRAKYGLIVIGCVETYTKNPLWVKYIKHCQEKGVLVQGSLNNWERCNISLDEKDVEEADQDAESDDDGDSDVEMF